jgi:hypothetical protein
MPAHATENVCCFRMTECTMRGTVVPWQHSECLVNLANHSNALAAGTKQKPVCACQVWTTNGQYEHHHDMSSSTRYTNLSRYNRPLAISAVATATQPEHFICTALAAASRTQLQLATGVTIPCTHICGCCTPNPLLEDIAGIPATSSAAQWAAVSAPASAASALTLVPAAAIPPVIFLPVKAAPIIVPPV